MQPAEQPPTVPGLVLGDVLGRGAGGPVWSAVDAAGQRRAVKVLPVPRHGPAPEDARLEVAASAFAHEHVVRVHDVVACAVDGQPALALVMERLDGGSLAQVLAERGRLSAGEVVTVIAPVASALAALHARGIVHGDVSPGNVLLAANGKPALADLGVARVVGDARGEVAGTDGVLAPEVEYGGLPSPASDVHALGALAWWCLTGSAPGSALVRRPLAELAVDAPAPLVAVVEAAAAPDPGDRPSALELATAVFDAAPPEPLRISPGGTEATALTRRIREAHSALPGPALVDRAGRRSPRAALASTRLRLPQVRLPPVRLPRVEVAWAPVAVAIGAVLLTVLGLVAAATGWLPTPQRAGAAPVVRASGPAPAPSPAPAPAAAPSPSPVARASTTTNPAHTAPLLEQPDAPTRDPRAVAAALLAARAQLWNAPDLGDSLRPEALAAVHAPGCRSLADDVRLLTAARADGFRYSGVGFSVVSARVASPGPTVRLSVVLDVAAYVVRSTDGSTDARPARAGQRLDLDVVRTGAGWRLAAIMPVR